MIKVRVAMMDIGRTLYVLFGRAAGGRFRKEQ